MLGFRFVLSLYGWIWLERRSLHVHLEIGRSLAAVLNLAFGEPSSLCVSRLEWGGSAARNGVTA
jgi:hypothetical protein